MIISEGYATDGKIMAIGNTQTPVKFKDAPDAYMSKWFKEKPTHHFAMSVGSNSSVLSKVASVLNVKSVII